MLIDWIGIDKAPAYVIREDVFIDAPYVSIIRCVVFLSLGVTRGIIIGEHKLYITRSILPSAMLHRVTLVRTDDSEEIIACIIRVIIVKLGASVASYG
jgi:hypothetical protein